MVFFVVLSLDIIFWPCLHKLWSIDGIICVNSFSDRISRLDQAQILLQSYPFCSFCDSTFLLLLWICNFFMPLSNHTITVICLCLLFVLYGGVCFIYLFIVCCERNWLMLSVVPSTSFSHNWSSGKSCVYHEWLLEFCVPTISSLLLVSYWIPSHCCSCNRPPWKELHFAFTRCC